MSGTWEKYGAHYISAMYPFCVAPAPRAEGEIIGQVDAALKRWMPKPIPSVDAALRFWHAGRREFNVSFPSALYPLFDGMRIAMAARAPDLSSGWSIQHADGCECYNCRARRHYAP